MSDPILVVSGVSKRYTHYRSIWHRLMRWFGIPLKPKAEFAAVSDISFSVERGESVALIGQNGAGKSTILKLITGTTQPTTGGIHVGGRVGAILELGLGFNQEFTGRQNVYQAGGLLGYSADELTAIMPEVIEFSELGDFFDQPFRVYSSGMQARLAFSLVTATRPDVLIIDEILAVGDSYFQHKSFERIREFKEQGSTIILVTHSLGDVRTLCDRALLLDKGHVIRDGMPDEVVDHYNALIAEKENAKLSVEQRRLKDGWLHSEFGTLEASVTSIELLDAETLSNVGIASVGQKLKITTHAVITGEVPRLVLGHRLTDRQGNIIWGSNTWHTRQVLEDLKPGDRVTFELDFTCTLGPGSYAINFGLVSSDTHLVDCYHKAENKLVFDVVNTDRPIFIGTSALDAVFSTSVAHPGKALRVAVVSSPRSGNTWLSSLLLDLYAAKSIKVHTPDELDLSGFEDENLVLQLHWLPDPEFVELLHVHGFKVVTLTRHPLDLLLSILQFAPSEPQTARWLDGQGGDETEIYGVDPNSEPFIRYASGPRAKALLSVSEQWAKKDGTITVRYEDLVADTLGTLGHIVTALGPTARDLNDVVTAGSFANMKNAHSGNTHFWKGQPGLWTSVFNRKNASAIADVYQSFIAELHYEHPTRENGAEVPASDGELKRRWVELCQ